MGRSLSDHRKAMEQKMSNLKLKVALRSKGHPACVVHFREGLSGTRPLTQVKLTISANLSTTCSSSPGTVQLLCRLLGTRSITHTRQDAKTDTKLLARQVEGCK